jgi:hypothetical protein
MIERAAILLRDVAALYREPDARVVLAPTRRARWFAWRHLVALVQLRSERVPLPGAPGFELEEEALRVAADAEHLIVARINEARQELAGAAVTAEKRDAWERMAAALEGRAKELIRSAQ